MYDKLIKQLRECTAEMNGEKTLWHQAADAIEELQQITTHYEEESKGWWLAACDAKEERERLKEQIPKWIPVTERLPDGEAIAFNALKGSYGYHEYLLGYVGADSESDTGFCCENEGEILMNVTHWMPLPEPPERGE